MHRSLRLFEKIIVISLLMMMVIAVFFSTIEPGVVLVGELLKPPFMLLDLTEMLQVFGFFLMVLIGVELLETIKSYIDEDRVHAELVFLVAMVAVARKVIILDYGKIVPDLLYGVSAVIIALGVSYFLVVRALAQRPAVKKQATGN